MLSESFLFPFYLAVQWGTLGAVIVRTLWRVSYGTIYVFWLMTVFGFTLLNRGLFFEHFAWPHSVYLSVVAIFGPIIAYLGYGDPSERSADPSWGIGFGVTIIVVAAGFTMSAKEVALSLRALSNGVISEHGILFFSLLNVVFGLYGVSLLLRMRRMAGKTRTGES